MVSTTDCPIWYILELFGQEVLYIAITCVGVCVCMLCVCVCACVHVRACVCVCTHACVCWCVYVCAECSVNTYSVTHCVNVLYNEGASPQAKNLSTVM